MIALVGYTGFVGSNILEYGKIDRVFNSKNITEAYGLKPDILIYAGIRAEKYIANQNPIEDLNSIMQAERNISLIAPKKLVLISTIDVYKSTNGVDETSKIETQGLQQYGKNRYILECWVREHFQDALIIRLPGLFGKNIKKNFIYDLINFIPFRINEKTMKELCTKNGEIADYYLLGENNFFELKEMEPDNIRILKKYLEEIGFSALNFTDSRNIYQFYPLNRLWNDIQVLLENDIRLWNAATEPVEASMIYKQLTGKTFCNELETSQVSYNFKTIHADVFARTGNYIMNTDEVLGEILSFVKEYQK